MAKQSVYVIGTDREARAAVAKGNRTDFRLRGSPSGLQLRVTAGGVKTWALAYRSPATGKWSKVALGRFPDIGISGVRELAFQKQAEVRTGRDPVHDRRDSAIAETFDSLAKRYIREHEAKNERDGRRSRSTVEAQRILDHDLLPLLGTIRAEAVKKAHVMQAVEAIADRGSLVIADRAMGLVRSIYNWACGTGRLDHNPTLYLKKRNVARPKTRVLTWDELRAFWLAIDAPGFTPTVRDAMRLQLATGVRIGEALGAACAEFDIDRAVWTIPAVRTKAVREHVIPLSPLAVAIITTAMARNDIEEARRARRHHRPVARPPWLFPTYERRKHKLSAGECAPLDGHSATRAIVRNRDRLASAGIPSFNTHDLRRTVATHMGEMGVADEVIERILNHRSLTVSRVHYNHSKRISDVRSALLSWGEKLSSECRVDII